jgi:dTDP-4-dehydrorhamnose reductase
MRIVIIGAGGRLGAALAREYASNFDVRAYTHADVDLADLDRIRQLLRPIDFDLLVNSAALTNVDYCEDHRDEAFMINAEAPRVLAELCQEKNAKLIQISTDYVFDGKARVPYREEDEAIPLSVYGKSKREGELRVLGTSEQHLVARLSWVFGPDRPSFVDQVIQRARETSQVAAVADKFSTPTYTLDFAWWLRAAWEKDLSGLLHLANGGECSWQQYAQYAIDCCHQHGLALQAKRVEELKLGNMKNFIAQRPAYSVLSTATFTRQTGVEPRNWREAVAEYIRTHVIKR